MTEGMDQKLHDPDPGLDMQAYLGLLREARPADLAGLPWLSEHDRWTELVFCLLDECTAQGSDVVRALVATLDYLGLTRAAVLSGLGDGQGERRAVVEYVLAAHGFTPQETGQAVDLLAELGKAVQVKHGGKMQRYLRTQGIKMRDELVALLGAAPLPEEQLRFAVTHWLQNALNLPVPLEHPRVLEFLARNKVSLDQLVDAAEALDLNLAYVDDLLAADLEEEDWNGGD